MAAPDPDLLERMIEHAPVGIVALDAAGIVVTINAAARRMFGRAFVGSHISTCADKYEILDTDERPCPADQIPLARAALFGETIVDRECLVRRPDGAITRVLASARPLVGDDGSARGAFLAMRDITTERASDARRVIEERRFEALAFTTAQMVWTADPSGSVVDDSVSWRAYTGQTFEEYRGYGWMDVVHADDRERVREAWLGAVARRSSYEVEYRVRHVEHGFRWTVARGAPVVDPDGTVVEWVGCNWDVHTMKSAEESAARAAEFHQLMLGVVGHDLRNPLAAICNGAELLALRGDGSETPARILRSAKRALSVLESLIDVTQQQLAGGLDLRASEFDLAELAAEVIAEFDGRNQGRALRLAIRGSTRGRWDRTRLGQVISNLVANAVQHGTGDIHLELTREADRVVLVVSNPCADVPPAIVETLFEPFRRARRESGSRNIGLGLYIVKQLVDAHRGTVHAEVAGDRMRVVLSLPASVERA